MAYQRRCQERWAALAAAGRRGSCLQPKTENRGSFILAPCAPTRNSPLSVLRKPPFPVFSQLPLATCLLPSHTHPKPSLQSPGDTRNAHLGSPSQPSQGTYQLWAPKDRGARGRCWGSRLQPPSSSSGAASFGLSLNYPLTLSVFVSPLLWSLFLSHSPFLFDCLCHQSHLLSLSLISVFHSVSLSHTHLHTPISLSLPILLFLSKSFSLSFSLFHESLSHSLPGSLSVLPVSVSLPHSLFLFLSLSLWPSTSAISSFPNSPHFLSSSLSQFLFPLCWSFLPSASRPRRLPSQSRLTPPLLPSPPQPDPWLSCTPSPGSLLGRGLKS